MISRILYLTFLNACLCSAGDRLSKDEVDAVLARDPMRLVPVPWVAAVIESRGVGRSFRGTRGVAYTGQSGAATGALPPMLDRRGIQASAPTSSSGPGAFTYQAAAYDNLGDANDFISRNPDKELSVVSSGGMHRVRHTGRFRSAAEAARAGRSAGFSDAFGVAAAPSSSGTSNDSGKFGYQVASFGDMASAQRHVGRHTHLEVQHSGGRYRVRSRTRFHSRRAALNAARAQGHRGVMGFKY